MPSSVFKHMANTNQELCVRGVIIRNDRILVCRAKEKDHYFFPGGHIEFGETAETALGRELQEELGLSMNRSLFIGAVENIFQQDGIMHHELNVVFEVQIAEGEIESQEAHIEFKWIDWTAFSEIRVLPIALQQAIIQWIGDKKNFWSTQA